MLTQHRVQEVAISVDGPVEVAPAAADFHVGLVDVPGAAGLAAALGAQLLTDDWRKAKLPDADGLVADLVAALQAELSHVAEAELVAQTPKNSEENHVGRELEIVE